MYDKIPFKMWADSIFFSFVLTDAKMDATGHFRMAALGDYISGFILGQGWVKAMHCALKH